MVRKAQVEKAAARLQARGEKDKARELYKQAHRRLQTIGDVKRQGKHLSRKTREALKHQRHNKYASGSHADETHARLMDELRRKGEAEERLTPHDSYVTPYSTMARRSGSLLPMSSYW